MILFKKVKDGGPDSPVDAYFLIEIKWLLSIAVLKFNKGGREQYHTHAFNALTWFLKGSLKEEEHENSTRYIYKRSFIPKFTSRIKNHRVVAAKDSWCITLRGPWRDTWTENDDNIGVKTTFTHGRKVINKTPIK